MEDNPKKFFCQMEEIPKKYSIVKKVGGNLFQGFRFLYKKLHPGRLICGIYTYS